MTVRFSLTPFPGEERGPDLKITGTIARHGDTLSIDCAIRGTPSELAIPSPEDPPERRDRLWEDTCLEIFLAAAGSEPYWEFHLSPAGHWNVYRFTGYREGRAEEPAFSTLPFLVRREPEAVRLSLDLGLARILPAGTPIEAAVCAVVRTASGKTTHWALAHTGPRPDFHRRDGFAVTLPRPPQGSLP